MHKKFQLFLLALLCANAMLWAQTKQISGVVVSKEGSMPLPGVVVQVKGGRTQATTDKDGYYRISASQGQHLVFSYIGKVPMEYVVGMSGTINVSLMTSYSQPLDSVVVTAYGQNRKRRELSYSAQTVNGDDLAQTKRDNFIDALAGRVPGLTINSTSGTPGSSSQIFLRTPLSMSGNNQPLFVVDGLPVSNQTLSTGYLVNGPASNANSDFSNRIADLNPNDIESVTILKGPEAAALYGSDGASGAIVITTKRGVAGKAVITYDNSFRFDHLYKYPEIQTMFGIGQRGIYDPTAYNANSYSGGGFYMFGGQYPDSAAKYDNIHNFFRTGKSQQQNISVESGNSIYSYRFSGSYLNTTGVVPNTSYTRYNFRLSGTAKLNSKMMLTASASLISTDNKKAPKGAGGYYLNLLNYPVVNDIRKYMNPDGSRLLILPQIPGQPLNYSGELDNPFWNVYKNPAEDKTDRFIGNLRYTYDPFTWWQLIGNVGFDIYNTEGTYAYNPQSKVGSASNGYYGIYTNKYKNYSGTFSSIFKKKWGKISNTLNLSAYFENNIQSIYSMGGSNFYEPNFYSINNTSQTTQTIQSTYPNSRKVRFLGSYTIGYNNLLYITASGTDEGNSTLSSTIYNKTPFFKYGALTGSFIFSDLGFMKTQNFLTYGKLRGGMGTTGKGPYAPYIIDNTFTSAQTGGFVYGITQGNINLKPEFTTTYEAGAELKFFQNRLGIDITYYKTNTKGQINLINVPYASGFTKSWVNGGNITSNGVEILVTGAVIKTKQLQWNITGNFNTARGHVVSMPSGISFLKDGASNVFGSVMGYYRPGFPIGGLIGSTLSHNNQGQVLISQTTGLPVTSSSTDSLIGKRMPDFTVGLINSFTIGSSWNISFNLDFRKGGDVFNGNKMYMIQEGVSPLTLDRNRPRVIKGVLNDGLQNSSTPTPNTIAVIPNYRVSSGSTLGNDFYSSAFAESDFIEHVNWMRMKDVTISYTLPKKYFKGQSVIKGVSVFVTGTDLFVITNYSGLDPNTNATNASATGYGAAGIDFGAIPTPRSFNFGLKATF